MPCLSTQLRRPLASISTTILRNCSTSNPSNSINMYTADECPASSRLRHIFQQAVRAVQPEQLIANSVKYDPLAQTLQISSSPDRPSTLINLTGKQLHLIGFGKAVLGMAVPIQRLLGDRLASGLLSVPLGIGATTTHQLPPGIEIFEGAAQNLPDAAAAHAAGRILQLAGQMRTQDVLIVLVSGGGSALLALPIEPVTIAEKQALCRALAARQATIGELNAVRRALSQTKGGRVAVAARNAAAVVTLAISDVCGDDGAGLLHVIASGPTMFRTSGERRNDAVVALRMLGEFGMLADGEVPNSVRQVLQDQANKSAAFDEDEEEIRSITSTQSAHIIGSNAIACRAAAVEAGTDSSIIPIVISTVVQGDVACLSEAYVRLAQIICQSNGSEEDEDLATIADTLHMNRSQMDELLSAIARFRGTQSTICVIAGGEPTVRIRGPGRGGRNQELALRISHLLAAQHPANGWCDRVHFLAAGTDGIDGPTDAAGALASARIGREGARDVGDLAAFIAANDSYSFYRRWSGGAGHVVTGHTGTNVMDLHVMLVQSR